MNTINEWSRIIGGLLVLLLFPLLAVGIWVEKETMIKIIGIDLIFIGLAYLVDRATE